MLGNGERLVVTGTERRCKICVSGRREPILVRQGKQNSQDLKAEEVLPEFWPRCLGVVTSLEVGNAGVSITGGR